MRAKYFLITTSRIVLAASLLFLASCDEFVSERPSKGYGVVIKTTSDLNAFLNHYIDYCDVSNKAAIFGTDDNGLSTTMYSASPYTFSMSSVMYSLWDLNNLANIDISDWSGNNFWSSEYAKILNANVVLANVDKVTGPADEKADLTADAHFIRAYSYWELANTYCLPYTPANKNEPGLPIVTQPGYSQSNPRLSLEATYQQIETDLTEALKTTVPLVKNGVARHWRANTAAVNGFAARYYLNGNDYTKALQYANAALAEYSTLVDYKTDMYYGNSSFGNGEEIKFPYTHDQAYDYTDMLGWKEFMYFRMLQNPMSWYIPSQSLLSLYDQTNDLRYKYHYVQNYSYKKWLSVPFPGYVFFAEDKMPEGPTVAEVILIKAECQARIGAGDVSGAMATVNLLYSKRTEANTPALTALTQAQAITVILQERRREMPFSARLFDIRRLNNNDYAGDDVADLSRTFYPYTSSSVNMSGATQVYTIPKNSRRWASPLPQPDISSSAGSIIQNTY